MVLTMLLTSLDVFGPVARSGSLVVKQTTYAELLGGGAVPAGPIPGAGGFVAEDTVQPVAMLGRDRRISLAFAIAVVRPPGIIAALGDTPMLASEHETVRTIEQLRSTVYAFPITIAILDVAHHARLGLARILLLLAQRACKRVNMNVPSLFLFILHSSQDRILRSDWDDGKEARLFRRIRMIISDQAEFFSYAGYSFFFSYVYKCLIKNDN